MGRSTLLLGAVAYDPKVVTIWEGFREFFGGHGLDFDVVLFTSLYTVAFVAALRRVPLFPRLLLAIWIGDITMQLVTAQLVASTPGLPATVAGALHALLEGNVKKVLISVALWLPYLLLSRRVNVTYRHRVA